jgi:hypothetical protein
LGKSSLSAAPQPKAAQTFSARTFSNVPVTIQPVLTPDTGVYSGKVLEILQAAERSLYMQTQYIHPSDQTQDKDFMALIEAVRDKHRGGRRDADDVTMGNHLNADASLRRESG